MKKCFATLALVLMLATSSSFAQTMCGVRLFTSVPVEQQTTPQTKDYLLQKSAKQKKAHRDPATAAILGTILAGIFVVAKVTDKKAK